METHTEQLPKSDAPTLVLRNPTREEQQATWTLNGQAWRGPMSIDSYIRRERHLLSQDLLRDGGITFWILVDKSAPPNHRPILASCESIRKRALITREAGQVEEVTSHGICSVFCNPKFRGKGYAQRMIKELAKKLDTWQQEDGRRADFTVLFSDIGTNFYSRMGWRVFPSSHVSLPPNSSEARPGFPSKHFGHFKSQDLSTLCRVDEEMLRKALGQPSHDASTLRVALIPDLKTIQWHHAREEFAAKELLNRNPEAKGAYVTTNEDEKAWCIWLRTYGNDDFGNTLHILRFCIQGEEQQLQGVENEALGDVEGQDKRKIRAGAAVLEAAQHEARTWNMKDVQMWNPSPLALLAAQAVEPSAQLIYRDKESISSLRWHGLDTENTPKIEWVGNEKYGWC